MSLGLLPSTPRKPKTSRLVKRLLVAFFLFLLGAGMFFGLGGWSVHLTQELLEDRSLFATGEKAEPISVEGTQRSRKFIFHEYDLTLTYLDKEGKMRTAKEEFISVGFSVDEQADAEIRYDKTNPARAVSSWALDVMVGRVLWSLLAFAISLVGLLVFWAVKNAVVEAIYEQKGAREGLEVRLEVSEVSRDQHGNITYSLRFAPNAGEVLNGSTTIKNATPLWIGERISLGLFLPEERRVFLVESDGQPVVLGHDELWAMRERADAMLRVAKSA